MPLKGLSDVKKAMADLKESANDDVAGVYLAGMKNMIEQTPAQSGGTRNSWFLSTKKQVSNTARKPSINGSDSISSVLRGMPKSVLGKTLYFVNNSPPINLLEYGGYPKPVKKGTYIDGAYQKLSSGGFSKQAPGGWVRKTLKLMRKKIRSLR